MLNPKLFNFLLWHITNFFFTQGRKHLFEEEMNGIWAIFWLFKPKHAAAEAVEIHGYSKCILYQLQLFK